MKKKITVYEDFNKKKETYQDFTPPQTKEHEMICTKCSGSGIEERYINRKGKEAIIHCKKCKGFGKITWLENVFGKQESDWWPS